MKNELKKKINTKLKKAPKKVKKLTFAEKKALKLKEKKEGIENYKFFNLIKGYVPSLNVVINDLGDYIIMMQVLKYNSLKYIINNMLRLKVKELEVFNYKGYHFLSLKFDVKKFNNKKKETFKFDNITKFIKDIEWRKDEFRILRLPEILIILKNKVYRKNDLNVKETNGKETYFVGDQKLRDVIINDNHSIKEFQNQIVAKNVKIENDFITFNNDESIKNQVLGLQMYPSFLYNGYLTELNHIKNIETCTYIKPINIKKCIDNFNKKDNISFQEMNLLEYMQHNFDNKINMYNTTFFIHIFGNDEEILKTKEIVEKISFKYHVILNNYTKQQRRCFSAFLPLMNNQIKSYRATTNYEGILPFNENIIKFFKNGFNYGYELFSGNEFNYNRFNNGIILSSNNSIKNYFMDSEQQDFFAKCHKTIYKINFKNTERLKPVNCYKIFKNLEIEEVFKNFNIDEDKLYVIFKIYLFICLSRYKDNVQIDINDKELLLSVFEKLEERIEIDGNTNFTDKVNRIFRYLEKNHQKLHDKIIKEYNSPSLEINNLMRAVFEIFNNTKKFVDHFNKYIYIYECQEIVDALDILFKYIFNNKFENTFLFSSSNDFLLLNNEYVSGELFKAKYINMLELSNNDISKVKKYLNLPNDDVVHLNNTKYYTGILYTDICEFNYYFNKNENKDLI